MSSAIIQSIQIPDYEDRSDPKPHTVYRIVIRASVREWNMWRRYSEFVDLHMELSKYTGSAPPASIPPKHALSIFTSHTNVAILTERRAGLETYLRAIISAKDDKWRNCYAFKEFLGIPIGKHAAIEGGGASDSSQSAFTFSSWLDEHIDLQTAIRAIRADINKRDALSDQGDISGSHQANLQAKKKLLGVQTKVDNLESGLRSLATTGMSKGELQRRNEMVARLRDDCEKLTKMVTVARHTSRVLGHPQNPAHESDRAALLGTGQVFGKSVTRVFGAPPPAKETEETRPLDDAGLVQLQQTRIEDQDTNLAQLSAILQRQKHLGLAINNEIGQQIEMLDSLDNDVDKFGAKLSGAKKQLNRLE